MAGIRRILFKTLGTRRYLMVLQDAFFALYDSGALRSKNQFANHYFVSQIVRKGDTVIDIGANLGYYSVPLARAVGLEGKVVSVEPIPMYNEIFMRKAKRYSNIELMPYALGREEGETELVTSTGEGYLSTGLPHIYDSQRDGDLSSQEFRFRAVMKRPSGLFSKLGRIDFIKCDIEGFEWIVLSDMEALIARHRPALQVEVWDDNRESLLGMFTGLGYGAYYLSDDRRLKKCPSAITAPTGDTYFIHNDSPLHLRGELFSDSI